MDHTIPLQKNIPERPNIHASYGIRSDTEGLLPWEWVSERMAKSRNYWICSTQLDGRPHAMPVWGVWIEDVFFFGTNRASVKGRNLASNPRVALHLESGDEAVMIEGIVVEVKEMENLTAIAAAYSQKYPGYCPDPSIESEVAMYAVQPKRVMAWLEDDFVNSATRWRFDHGDKG